MTVSFDGVVEGTSATLTMLTAPTAESYNSVGSDVVQTDVSTVTAGAGGAFTLSLPNLSISILEISGNATAATASSAKRRAMPRGYKEVKF